MKGHLARLKPIMSEINITPLTDIFLVLLIIVMIVAPIISRSPQEIRPPELDTGSPMDQHGFTVEITSAGDYFIDGAGIGDGELSGMLEARLPTLKTKNLIVRGDGSSKSAALLRVLEAAQAAGYEKVFVAGEDRRRVPGVDGREGNAE